MARIHANFRDYRTLVTFQASRLDSVLAAYPLRQ